MMAFMFRYKKKIFNKKGMTLVEAVISMVLVAILAGIIVFNVVKIANRAYMARADDTAQVIYMALQSSLKDQKISGKFEETFSENKRGTEYFDVSELVINGGVVGNITIPGVTGQDGNQLSASEKQKLIDSGNLVYLKISEDAPESSRLLKKLLSPYINDKSILDYPVLAEINLQNKTVRCAFYTERTKELNYYKGSAGSLNSKMLRSKQNVIIRERRTLIDKLQGYYGITGIGAPESIQELENAYVKVNNDDMLVVEWGEIGPFGDTGGVTDEKRKLFMDMTYDVSIVNAYDTSKVYYKIEDVSAYSPADTAYVNAGMTTVKDSSDPGKVRSPMPVYDLYDYNNLKHALTADNKVAFQTKELQNDGTMKEIADYKHRLSYYVPPDVAGVKQYGVYRLVLDSITSDANTALSIHDSYPKIPWDENFKVIVEGKYKGEGFTGSLSISEAEDNGYVNLKTVNPEEDLYVNGKRGAGILEEITNYLFNKENRAGSNMWYELAYARHLNNMRYIIGYQDEAAATAKKNGRYQNFLLKDDIDWSIQKLGAEEIATAGSGIKTIHRLTVSNAEGTDMTVTDASGLKVFYPITANDPTETKEAKRNQGFEGRMVSAAKRDVNGNLTYEKDEAGNDVTVNGKKVPVYENYQLSYLKIADSNKKAYDRNKNVGMFERVGQKGYLRNFMVKGVAVQGKENVGSIAGEFGGYAKNITLLRKEEANSHKRIVTYAYGGKIEEVIPDKMLEPYRYAAGSAFEGNTVKANEDYAGGAFGTIFRGREDPVSDDGYSGQILNMSNGTRIIDLYAGPINESDQSQNTAAAETAPISSLNGVAVKGRSYTGGLVGRAGSKTKIKKVANTGTIEASVQGAGGIAGVMEQEANIIGLDDEADGEEQYLTRDYTYQKNTGEVAATGEKTFKAYYTNYGLIKAGNYAGGVVGIVKGGTTPGDKTLIKHAGNTGPVQANQNGAGGIAGVADGYSTAIQNAQNKADVTALENQAGGIIGTAEGNVHLQGVRNLLTQSRTSLTAGNSGIHAGNMAGGIAGYLTGSVKVLHFKMDKEAGGVMAGALVRTANMAEVSTREDYAGGIAGLLRQNAVLNDQRRYGETAEVPMINAGNIVSGRDYAGGIVGAAVDQTVVRNTENQSQAHINTRHSAQVTAQRNNAGGIAGAVSSEAEIGLGTQTGQNVCLQNDVGLAYEGNEVKRGYYTNNGPIRAVGSNAGGIVGTASTDIVIENFFNQGIIEAGNNAGGIAGALHSETKISSEPTLLEQRMTLAAEEKLYTNQGAVSTQQSNAGGIAGIVSAGTVRIKDSFNSGSIIAGGNNAGGIAGKLEAYSSGYILEYSNQILDRLVISESADGIVNYTNVGEVRAGSDNAGGVAGFSAAPVKNVFNAGTITASQSAGGIAGNLQGDGNVLFIGYDTNLEERLAAHARKGNQIYSNAGIITAVYSNAGGIVGRAEQVVGENLLNRGRVQTIYDDNAGGIAGLLLEGQIRNTEEFAVLCADNRILNNSGTITANRNNAGGITGSISGTETETSSIENVFNNGTVRASASNAGGIAGLARNNTEIAHTARIVNQHVLQNKFMTNQANVSGGNNAGGITGKMEDGVIRDVYSAGSVRKEDGTVELVKDLLMITADQNNAGGVAGRLIRSEITNKNSIYTALSASVYTNNTRVRAGNNAGGIVGNADSADHADNYYEGKTAAEFDTANTGTGIGKNEFSVADVYNEGTVSAGSNNAGGVFGVAGDGTYQNNAVWVTLLIEKNMRTNQGRVTAGNCNAGGIIGFANEKFNETVYAASDYNGDRERTDVSDVFNRGDIEAKYNAGGIAGKAVKLKLKYSESVLTDVMQADQPDADSFVYTNESSIKAEADNAGGIIGRGDLVILQDTFNSGIGGSGTKSAYQRAVQQDSEIRVQARSNAGGLAGSAYGLDLSYSKLVSDQIKTNRMQYTYSNLANILATDSNAGGILGDGRGAVRLLDVYNMGRVEAGNDNAGGIAGVLNEDGRGSILDVSGVWGADGIDLSKGSNEVVAEYENDAGVPDIGTDGLGGSSYISYQTITSVKGDTTNRYSNAPKAVTIEQNTDYQIIAGRDNAGGIAGRIFAGNSEQSLRIEDVFNTGSVRAGREICGVWAKNQNAGGVAGYSENASISYSFPINPGEKNLDTGKKGDHSTFAKAFEDLEVRRDPYALKTGGIPGRDYIGLHMVPNNAKVRASTVEESQLQDPDGNARVEFESGVQDIRSENAGGAVGFMKKGRIERLYSLQGSIITPRNAGGIIGHANGSYVKQVFRLDGEEIALGTKLTDSGTLKERGSQNVGGIIGRASGGTQIYDVRNYTNIEGRTAVGGIVGYAETGTTVTLAQNANIIRGTAVSAEDLRKVQNPGVAQEDLLLLPLPSRASAQLDKSKADGSYVGGIVGRGDNTVELTMIKNDPKLTSEFSELKMDYVHRDKFALGGSTENLVQGKQYVGGITGAYGIINYAVNTGKIDALKISGGISGSGYRITNVFNTADVIGKNGNLYVRAVSVRPETLVEYTQATHIGGIAGELGERSSHAAIVQTAQEGAYIQNAFNSPQIVRGASYVGGIAGYAVAPVNVTYNSAVVSTKQTGNELGDPGFSASKVGGVIGVIAQDREGTIKVSNSYNAGEIIGTNTRGGLIGIVEGFTEELIPDARRVVNSYYLSDNDVKFWNSTTAQVSTQINYGLKPLDLGSISLEQIIEETQRLTMDGNPYNPDNSSAGGGLRQDTGYGVRNYSNMIRSYVSVDSPSAAGSKKHDAKGEENLKRPLNAGIDGNLSKTAGGQVNKVEQAKSSLKEQQKFAARFVYPVKEKEIKEGKDYEFPQLNFAGNIENDKGIEEIPLIDADNLPDNNQVFISLDNTRISNYHEYWPTKEIDYMKVGVEYNDGGNNDNSKYLEGVLQAEDANKGGIKIVYRYNDKYPEQRITRESVTLRGSFKQQSELPEYMNFDVYDGHSRGRYNYDNETFKNLILPKTPMKTYTLAKKRSYDREEPHKYQTVLIPKGAGSTETEEYYFYAKDTTNTAGDLEYNSIDKIRVTVTNDGTEVTIKILLPNEEMNSYLPADSGYFTMEATKVYDQRSGIAKEEINTKDRTSRMFSMHFSNTELNEAHNDSILDKLPTLDFDDIRAEKLIYPTMETAALGSSLLKKNAAGEYETRISNKLQIRNERHLYNINQGETMGYAEIGSSNLFYTAKELELKNNIQLSTDRDGYNGFVIGASNKKMYRMTGSLDGNGYTIGNIRVNRRVFQGDFANMASAAYALIYDLSGGIVKNLYIGNDSKIVAQSAAGLAYYVSNGRSATKEDPYTDTDNALFENLEPQLPEETGTDAKIYRSEVLARISAQDTGGIALRTARRFTNSRQVPNGLPGKEDEKLAVTITDSSFGGIINGIYSRDEDAFMQDGNGAAAVSAYSAGILCYVSGKALLDDIDTTNPNMTARDNYRTRAEINGCQVSENGYVYAANTASGILGLAEYPGNRIAQKGMIRKSANNGSVAAGEQANGITQGIISLGAGDTQLNQSCGNESSVEVQYGYNNGIVQTPDDTGLASGIGNFLSTASYCTNNGSVIGRIASGISSYGDKHQEINYCANNGYVQGLQIAGGIVGTPSVYDRKETMAVPSQEVHVKLSNCYNSGRVVVMTNTDNEKAGRNSYAGGILGYASGNHTDDFSWDQISMEEIWNDGEITAIREMDERKTVLRNCYNAGEVQYVAGYTSNTTNTGTVSHNHRNIGGIVGGGLNRLTDIQNCYSLSDYELKPKASSEPIKLLLSSNITDFKKYGVEIKVPEEETGYNYKLTSTGDASYGSNVSTMGYADMQVLDNFSGFNQKIDGTEEAVWTIDQETLDEEGNVLYPYPQFVKRQESAEDAYYIGDTILADVPDAAYNVKLNKEKFDKDVITTADRMNTGAVTQKSAVESKITYQDSQYSIQIKDYDPAREYQITVYDGDAYAQNYMPSVIRKYEILAGGRVTGGGKLHNEHSVTTAEGEMQFFDERNITFKDGQLNIHQEEELGFYMPNSRTENKTNGYYTVLVTITKKIAKDAGFINKLKAFFAGGGTASGLLKTEVKAKTSERFQIHFGGTEADGSNIESRGIVDTGYKYGTKTNPYLLTDQYSIIGMTTAGIAQRATEENYYKQSSDIYVDRPFYGIFEFNGVLDGGGYKIRQDNGSVGFISYLRTSSDRKEARPAQVQNLDITVNASGTDQMERSGKYLEAANYAVNIGVIADYMEDAQINNSQVGGTIHVGGFNPLADTGKYLNNHHTIAGVAAVTRGGSIETVRNNAEIGVKQEERTMDIPLGGGKVTTVTYEVPGPVAIEAAGIAALVRDTKVEQVSNNGKVMSGSENCDAAGLIHTMRGSDAALIQSVNGGQVKAHNGTAAGLVKTMEAGKVSQSYNSGKVTALAFQGAGGAGTAIGCIADLPDKPADISEIYNAGYVSGMYQGAISSKKRDLTAKQVYYLKDANLYWGDEYTLPESQIVTEEKDISLYLGFAKVPAEVWAFADSTREDYVIPGSSEEGTAAGYRDPYALEYEELTNVDTMSGKGFAITGGSAVWTVDPSPENDTVDAGNPLLRDYSKDPYPLPQLTAQRHGIRKELSYPLYFGIASQTGKVPYKDGERKVKYVPRNAADDLNQTEIFKDTIAVDLNEMNTTNRYEVLIYDGDAELDDLKDKHNQKILVTVERKYIDIRNPEALAEISDSANMQYSEIIRTDEGGFYYEVMALAADGGKPARRPAVFASKQFTDSKNEIVLNNTVLDEQPEPADSAKPYYSATVIEYQIPGKEEIDANNFYGKFSPHFANATAVQDETWTYGTNENPYEIATQRNLYNISMGGRNEAGTKSHYLTSAYQQTQDLILKRRKDTVAVQQNQEGARPELWKQGIGTEGQGFSGSYTAKSSEEPGENGRLPAYRMIDQRDSRACALFDRMESEAKLSDISYLLDLSNSSSQAEALLVKESAGKISNITIGAGEIAARANINMGSSNPTALVAGSIEGNPAVKPSVIEQILVESTVTVSNANSGKQVLGTVIGEIKTAVNISNLESSAELINNVAGRKEGCYGGIIGKIKVATQDSPVQMSDITYKGSITDNAAANHSIGGIIGSVEDTEQSSEVRIKQAEIGRIDTDTGLLEDLIQIAGSQEDAFHTGGLIGKVVTTQKSTKGRLSVEDVNQYGNITVDKPASGDSLGGLIGYSEAYDIQVRNTKTLGTVTITNASDEADLYAGGFFGRLKDCDIMQENTAADGSSNLWSQGAIKADMIVKNEANTSYAPGTLYIGGNTGMAENSGVMIKGFRNSSDIEVTGLNKDANVMLAGAVAYAKGRSSGSIGELYITTTLNEGKILDNRTELTKEEQDGRTRTPGYSVAAGIVGTSELEQGSRIIWNHNAGAIKATTAAGIIHTLEGEENIRRASVKRNINVGVIDVNETFENGAEITMTMELPVSRDADGNDYNAQGQKIVTVQEPEETEENAEDPDGSVPEAKPVMEEYYNLSLEDMIRPEKEQAAVSLTGAMILSLAEMQDLSVVKEKAGWDAAMIAESDSTDPVSGASFWMMHPETTGDGEAVPYLMPVLRANEYVPAEDVNYMEKAPYGIFIEETAAGDYKVGWSYDSEIDVSADGFAVIVKTTTGETKKIIELRPGVALPKSDGISYSYTVPAGYLANITNELEADQEHLISIAAMRDANGRRMQGYETMIQLRKTTDMTVENESLVMVVEPTPGTKTMGYSIGSAGIIGQTVVNYAYTRLGDPYSMPLAGQGNYLDCSYLVLESYRAAGIEVPRTAGEQLRYCEENGAIIAQEELRTGDLIFYNFEDNGHYKNISHVVIYAGNGKVIEAGWSQGQVVVSDIYFNQAVAYGRPYVEDPTMENTEPVGAEEEEIYLVAQIVGLEAGGTGREGMIAVAEVIRNRMLSEKFPNTLTGVVAAPGQFTTYAMVNGYTPTNEQVEIVREVMQGRSSVLNNPNCLYFCSYDYFETVGKYDSFWGGMSVIAEYGNVFFVP